MPNRETVYAVIDGERQYQHDIWQTDFDLMKPVGSYLLFLRGYYNDAIQVASHSPGGIGTLHMMRTLAELAFACMESNGIVGRYGPKIIVVPGNVIPVNRDVVKRAIDIERSYQDELPSGRTDGSNKSPDDYLVMFGTYLRRAEDGWTNHPDNVQALDNIRKLGAIAVRCMEEHGAPHREGY